MPPVLNSSLVGSTATPATVPVSDEPPKVTAPDAASNLERTAVARRLDVERQAAVDGYLLARGADATELQVGVRERVAVTVGCIRITDRCVADVDARDFECRVAGRAVILGGFFLCRRVGLQQVRPVAPTLLVHAQVEPETVDGRCTDFEFAPEDQRDEPDAEAGALELGEVLVAEARRIAETRGPDFDGQPREHAQPHVALDRQLATGLFKDHVFDLVTKVVRVDEQSDGHRRDDEKHAHRDDEPQYELACAAHGNTLGETGLQGIKYTKKTGRCCGPNQGIVLPAIYKSKCRR